ncbi:DUF4340 domain-containing protein [Thiotrichales bacterium HSG1]|nr:DUF4340 domain-containing protein [Thiotrichales bacterium HSG1]
MNKRWLMNIILLIIVVILGALVFYTIDRNKQVELPKLTDLNQAQTIHIERLDKEPITLLKKTNDLWQITTPFDLPANKFQVENLLQILSLRDYKKITSSNLAEFKLDSPLATIKFDQLTVEFGDSSPINHQRYIKVDDNIYLLRDSWYYYLTGDALAFASFSLLGDKPKITELEMPNYHLKLQDTKWALKSGQPSAEIDTSIDALGALIDNWQHASAYDVKPYDKTISKEQIKVTLLGQPQPLNFFILSKSPDLILARPEKNVQYKLSKTQLEKLLQLPIKMLENSDLPK